MQSVSYSIALFSVIAADIQRMIRDDLNVLADALQNSRHDNGAEQRAELITDAGQCILLRVKAGQLFGMAGGKRLYALVLCTGGSLGQQQRGADIVLQQLQCAVEEFRAETLFVRIH